MSNAISENSSDGFSPVNASRLDRHSQMSTSVVERSSHSAQEAMVQKRISPSNSPAVLVILTLLFVCVGAEVSDVFCGDDVRREEV